MTSPLDDVDFAMLDPLPPEPPAEEFVIEYAADPRTVTSTRLLVQELPRVCTLAMAETMCRISEIGADLLDVTTLVLRHRLNRHGLLVPICNREEAAA